MISTLASARAAFVSALSSHRAMAASLVAGALLATGVMPSDAMAQRKKKEEEQQSNQPSNTPAFVEAYRPAAALVTGNGTDWAGARAAVPGVVAAIGNNVDRNVAGNFMLRVGNELQDNPLRRQGLELMLESGMVAPEQVGLFNYYVGTLAYNGQDYDAARAALQRAIDVGYTDGDSDANNDPLYIIVQSYFLEDRDAEAIAFVVPMADDLVARGDATSEAVILRTLQGAIDTDDGPAANALSAALVSISPDKQSWMSALQVVNAVNDLSPDARLDLLRLMREADVLSQRAEYVRYIENADPRIMSNEVLPVLADAVRKDIFTTSDAYYTEVKGIADSRAAIDRREIETNVREARQDGGNVALTTGDVLYSLKDYARAEEIYKLALDTGADRDTALTRIGMMQIMQDKHAAAGQTLAQVGGERAPVAKMWALYAKSLMPQSASMDAAAEALDEAAEAVEAASQAVEAAS